MYQNYPLALIFKVLKYLIFRQQNLGPRLIASKINVKHLCVYFHREFLNSEILSAILPDK